jgi:hypothetical protein
MEYVQDQGLTPQAGLVTEETRAVQVASRDRRGGSYTNANCKMYRPIGGVRLGNEEHSLSGGKYRNEDDSAASRTNNLSGRSSA